MLCEYTLEYLRTMDPADGTQRLFEHFAHIGQAVSSPNRVSSKIGRRTSTCMDARGITPGELAEGSHRGTMDELTEWVATSDRVLSF